MKYFLEITLILLICSYFLLLIRLIKGPTTADRVVAIDLIAVTSVAFLLLISLKSNEPIYIDIAIALAFVGFLATLACSRFILLASRSDND
ncbi:MAG TPA: monovalent cation/H+ antiporter complex subunit F [Bacteriovoracaceae bacterium]|nr:monovalent cation/H+ antiporter complex subunit F [Bacteriovoracaceae bacterium]